MSNSRRGPQPVPCYKLLRCTRGTRAPLHLRLANVIANPLFSDVTRCFEDLLRRSAAALDVERDTPAMLGALYRSILLRKRA